VIIEITFISLTSTPRATPRDLALKAVYLHPKIGIVKHYTTQNMGVRKNSLIGKLDLLAKLSPVMVITSVVRLKHANIDEQKPDHCKSMPAMINITSEQSTAYASSPIGIPNPMM